jgi:hypothetical protein
MGASAARWAERMIGPEPDEGDLWVIEMAQVMRAKRERHERRTMRILEALREAAPITMDEEEVFL